MQEKNLLKIALISSLLGLLILYLISNIMQIKEYGAENIIPDNEDDFIKIKGVVSNVVDKEKVAVIKILQPKELTVLLFKKDNKTMPVKQGNEIEVIGKVNQYENKNEVIADKVRVVR
ncbi:hypothetical protein HYX01_03830 [Candidatus Woesearchaeota archaeon]|nr:hypothetical protein [Candidatus Woesearchaeota archaeon]